MGRIAFAESGIINIEVNTTKDSGSQLDGSPRQNAYDDGNVEEQARCISAHFWCAVVGGVQHGPNYPCTLCDTELGQTSDIFGPHTDVSVALVRSARVNNSDPVSAEEGFDGHYQSNRAASNDQVVSAVCDVGRHEPRLDVFAAEELMILRVQEL
mmetsp:Transcript_48919/g.72703  ORF Transcript_48919/g.72703 Transcript_48919/m.72703 type:complete len:155 (+) Transcript_48919:1132-1596(+)